MTFDPRVSSESLGVATPERIALELPVAGIGFRSLAYLIDLLVLFAFWVVAYFLLSLLTSDVLGLVRSWSGAVQTASAIGAFATQWLYWTGSEVLGGGRTIGKRAMGIRVVRTDGSPVTIVESAVRNLFRWIDFLPILYAAGLMTMLLQRQNRRIGDLVAGTLLVRDHAIDLSKYAPPVDAARVEHAAGGPPLTSEAAELVLDYLSRVDQLEPAARDHLGQQLIEHAGAHLSADERAQWLGSPQATQAFLRTRAARQA